MILRIAQSAIRDICIFLEANPDFFTFEQEKKISLAHASLKDFPTLAAYLCETKETLFMHDLEGFVRLLLQPSFKYEDNALLKAFFSFLVKDFPDIVESDKKFSLNTFMGQSIEEFIMLRSEKEISDSVTAFLGKYIKVPYIAIQTPLHLSYEDKKEIRERLLEKYTYAFPFFTVNPKLIGGMRILEDGHTEDRSWYGRVMNLSHLLHK